MITPARAEGTNVVTVTVENQHYRFLAETAAEHFGLVSARRLTHTGTHHQPGDPLSALLCEVWLIDPDLAKLALTAYMIGLRIECKRQDIVPPSLHDVVSALPHSIDAAQFPEIDFRAICNSFEDEVPALYGTSI